MEDASLACCGLNCSPECTYRETNNCPGCRAAEGKVFWGECTLATCCISKKLDHCGHCDTFPCDDLKAYSFSTTENGDNGRRIERLKEAR